MSPESSIEPQVALNDQQMAALVAAVVLALKGQLGPTPQSFDQAGAIAYVGIPRSTWFRLRSSGKLPDPRDVPGSGPRWLKRDLDHWLEKLKPRRRKAKREVVEA